MDDAPPPATRSTSPAELDQAIEDLGAAAGIFAAMAPKEKAALLRSILPRVLATARDQVEAACRAKGLDPASPLAGEEWLAGPCATLNTVRLLATSLDDIAKEGRPRLPRKAVRVRNGRVEVSIYPQNAMDAGMFRGFEAYVLIQDGTDRASVLTDQAELYQKGVGKEGGVSLVLGAGNVASIPPMDTLHKLFVEGKVVILKMSPVNAYLGPFFEAAFAPLIERGFLRVVYGGADVGAHLAAHRGVTDIHITGSAMTHDMLVWGPPGEERDRRKAENDPLLKKPITSELGNVSPIIVMPWLYAKDELWFQARNVATQVVNNASFNCNAAKMLVLPRAWPQRQLFLDLLRRALGSAAPRKAYYPGAFDRYEMLVSGHSAVEKLGAEAEGCLPWTLISGLDASDTKEPLFSTEPFCGIISEVEVGSTDPVEFLSAATAFCNERLWGTLSASIIAHPREEEDEAIKDALDRAIRDLRYGAVTLNHWPALVYGLVVPPWGGHPSATLADVQSGIGFVHNTLMIGRIEKAVVRGPLRAFPKPPYFFDNKRMRDVGERYAAFAADPGWGKLMHVATAAMRG
jgi:hypothetical protein